MTLNELKNTLDDLGVRNDAYSLKGGLPTEAYCISQEYGRWQVYYSERGQKSDLKNYRNEAKLI